MRFTFADLIRLPTVVVGSRIIFDSEKNRLIYTAKYNYYCREDYSSVSIRNSIFVENNNLGYSAFFISPYVDPVIDFSSEDNLIGAIRPLVSGRRNISAEAIIGFIKDDIEGGAEFLKRDVWECGGEEAIRSILLFLKENSVEGCFCMEYGYRTVVRELMEHITSTLNLLLRINIGDDFSIVGLDPDDFVLMTIFNEVYLRGSGYRAGDDSLRVSLERLLTTSSYWKDLTSWGDAHSIISDRVSVAFSKIKKTVEGFKANPDSIRSLLSGGLSGGVLNDFDGVVDAYFKACMDFEQVGEECVGFSVDPVLAKRIVDHILLSGGKSNSKIKEESKTMIGFFGGLRDTFSVIDEYGIGSLHYSFRKGASKYLGTDYFLIGSMLGLSNSDIRLIRKRLFDGLEQDGSLDELVMNNYMFKMFYDILRERGVITDTSTVRPVYDIFKTISALSEVRKNSPITAYTNIDLGGVLDFFAGFLVNTDVKRFKKWVSRERKRDIDKFDIFITIMASGFYLIYESYRDDFGQDAVKAALCEILNYFIECDVDYALSSIIRIKSNVDVRKFELRKNNEDIVSRLIRGADEANPKSIDLNIESLNVDVLRRISFNGASVSVSWLERFYRKSVATGKPISLSKAFYDGFYSTSAYNTIRGSFFSQASIIEYLDRGQTTYRLNGAFVNSNKNLFRAFDYLIYDYLNIVSKGDAERADFIKDFGIFYNKVMLKMSNPEYEMFNPLLFSVFLMFDYLLYADEFDYIDIDEDDRRFLALFRGGVESISIYSSEDVLDFGLYMDFNLIFSKYYKAIVGFVENDSMRLLPIDISRFYGKKIVRGDYEAKIIKPSILLNRLSSAIISGSNNYLSSMANKRGDAERGESIVSCADPLKFSGSVGCNSNVFQMIFKSVKLFKRYFSEASVESIDVNRFIRFQQVVNNNRMTDEDFFCSVEGDCEDVEFFNRSDYDTYSKIGSVYGFLRNDTYVDPNPINDVGVLFTYLLSGESRLKCGFLDPILGAGFGNELIMPVEISEKNKNGDKVKIHYYYLNVSFGVNEGGLCDRIAFGFNFVNEEINQNYPRSLNKKVKPAIQDLIQDLYEDNFHLLSMAIV